MMNCPNRDCCCEESRDDALSKSLKELAKKTREQMLRYLEQTKKEENAMQASYNEFTGELVKLERKPQPMFGKCFYDLSIYDSEKQVTHSFTNVNLSDVKFSGGAVSFGA